MAREFFCAYHSYLDWIENLSDAEKGRLFVACLQYSKTGDTLELCGNERIIFPAIRRQIDMDREAYEQKCAKLRRNGEKANATKCPPNGDQMGGKCPPREKGEGKREKKPAVSIPPLTPLEQALEDFKAHRKAMKKPMTPHAVELMLSRLDQMAPGDDDRKIAMLHQSIERGWVGVFDLKDDHSKSTGRLDNLQRLYQEVGE